ncbi:hypothetical protein FPV160 [Fowlpox virus]|uniref:Uncharacterized protein n=2 Tax=Fowlpox virus TaxID=10261 RepID=Q9J571_FOWPN|nr:hypothetical protein FPV160 [Fowlpox virus]UNS14378.1 ALPV-214 [Albatrosspox virus]WPD90868.1 hypothetical protein PPV_Vac110-fpv160 [Avipoxvirus sp.]AAF44504.1 ORF FPV160 hypothetical protein [Fowlpox virus]ART91593.1 hypothetical protein [Fowlpox virus]AXY04602.1 hypothetical protein [Fowlpox virus]
MSLSDKDTKTHGDYQPSNEQILQKIRRTMENEADSLNRRSIKEIVVDVMKNWDHPLNEEIDKVLNWKNDTLNDLDHLNTDDNIKEIIQCLIREFAFKKINSIMYSYAMVKLNSDNETLKDKIKDYFIETILKDKRGYKQKPLPGLETKILDSIIRF